MVPKILRTKDGSHTLYNQELDETYHSTHGAIQEARHVFIDNGLKQVDLENIRVFEMGFGTGLNALLTLEHAIDKGRYIEYTGIEAYPIDMDIVDDLNYVENIDVDLWMAYDQMHILKWNETHQMFPEFTFTKIDSRIEEYELDKDYFDLIYFDAFGPRAQQEMWTVSILQKMYDGLKRGGELVTYCAQGQFKRNLRSIGFEVESLPGPPGKREMTRAAKQ